MMLPRYRSIVSWLAPLHQRITVMECASQDFFDELRRLSVADLQALQPTPPYRRFVESLIALRMLMGD